ncbi:MAG TPA: HAD hydrolase-like protein [Candidatus Methylomirabilis sp.]|nr:HAD hydrolase-like protein [Candidatus Methylomirabilis sp.]
MIGDSPTSDIQGAHGVGLKTIWLAPAGAAPCPVQPDLTIQTFAELPPRH